jgi:uncharacterized protein (TIGR02099 family)
VLDNVDMTGLKTFFTNHWIKRFKALSHIHPKFLKFFKTAIIALIIFLVCAIAVGQIGVRYWIWPQLEVKKTEIEQLVSNTLGVQVSIGEIHTSWIDLKPAFEITHITFKENVGNASKKQLLEIPKIEGILDWSSLWRLSPSFDKLSINQADLKIIRNQAGQWFIAGVAIPESNKNSNGLDWLLHQKALQISNVSIDLLDQHDKTSSYQLQINQFEANNNGRNHALNVEVMSAFSSEKITFNSQFQHKFLSNQSNWHNWHGEVSWNVSEFNLAKFLSATHLPLRATSGTFNSNGKVGLNDGKFISGQIGINAEHLDIFWEQQKNSLRLKNISAEFTPTAEGELQYLQVKNLTWQDASEKIVHKIDNLDNLSFGWDFPGDSKSIGTFSVLSQRISLTEIHDLASQLPLPTKYLKYLDELKPQGQLENFYLSWHQPPADSSSLKIISYDNPQLVVSAYLKNVGWNYSSLKVAGFKGLSGELFTDLEKGSFKLDTTNATLEKGDIISRTNTKIDEAKANISWVKKNHQWHVIAKNVVLSNSDLLINANVDYLTGNEKFPSHLNLDLSIPRAKLGEFTSYLPKSIDSEVLNYLSGTLIAGDIKNAHLSIDGNPEKIPYPSSTLGKFKVTVPLENATFRPSPKSSKEPGEWQAFEKLNGLVKMDNSNLQVEIARAQFKNAAISDIKANADFSKDIAHLNLEGKVDGSLQDAFNYLSKTPTLSIYSDLSKDLTLSGDTKASVKLDFPFSDKAPTRFSVNVELNNNQVKFDNTPPVLVKTGKITMTDAGIEQADINAEWLGGNLSIKNDPNIKRTVLFNGKADFSKFGELILTKNDPTSIQIKKKLYGPMTYQGKFQTQDQKSNVDIEFDLKGVAIDLPRPLNKPIGIPMPGKATISSNSGNKNEFGFDWNLTLGDRLQSKGISKNGKIDKQGISLGNLTANLPLSGTSIVFDVDTLQGDEWAKILSADAASANSKKPIKPSDGSIEMTSINSIKGKAKHLIITDRDISDFSISATHEGELWVANVESPLVAGQFKWQAANLSLPSGQLTARLSKLIIPNEETNDALTQSIQSTSSRIPKLDISSDQFVIGKRNFGSLSIQATSEVDTWHLDNLKIKNPNGELNAIGIWKMPQSKDPGHTDLKIDINATHLGKLMDSLGNAKAIEDGEGKLEGSISWQGAPYAFDKKSLSGDLSFVATKGKLLKVDPGAAKLLGLLSFQSLFKLATFNVDGGIGDAVSEGTYFDKISATATLRRGVARTEDFELISSLAKINMRGRANLINETQDLRVTIYPKISLASTSLAAFYFVSPIVGLSTLVGQFLITSSINKILQADYLIQGSWKDPEIIPLDQNGKPLKPEIIDTIRRKSLLEDQKKPSNQVAPSTPIK